MSLHIGKLGRHMRPGRYKRFVKQCTHRKDRRAWKQAVLNGDEKPQEVRPQGWAD